MAESQGRVVIVDGEGKRHFFPAGFDPRRAASIVKQQTKAPEPREPGLATIGDQVNAKWSDRLGLNKPTASPVTGFMRGAGAGVVDLAQGATSEITRQLNQKLNTENEWGDALGGDETLPQRPTLPDVEAPQNMSGRIGQALPVVGELALPGGAPKALKAAKDAIPSTVRAGEKFQDVMSAAGNIPIQTTEVGDVALRINQLAERGGSMPMAVRKLLNRMTDPEKGALAYGEARDFASNISRLSANEFGRLTPAVAREVATLRVALNRANAFAAKQAGKLDEYNSAMREYQQAMKLKGAVDAAVSGVKKGAPVAGAGGLAYWLTNRVRDALGGQ